MKKILLFALFAVLSATNFYCTKTEDINTATEGIQQNLPEQAAPVSDRDDVCSKKVEITLTSNIPDGASVNIDCYRYYCGQQQNHVATLQWTQGEENQPREIAILNDESLELVNNSTGSENNTFRIVIPGKPAYGITIPVQKSHVTAKFFGDGLNCAYHDCGDEEY